MFMSWQILRQRQIINSKGRCRVKILNQVLLTIRSILMWCCQKFKVLKIVALFKRWFKFLNTIISKTRMHPILQSSYFTTRQDQISLKDLRIWNQGTLFASNLTQYRSNWEIIKFFMEWDTKLWPRQIMCPQKLRCQKIKESKYWVWNWQKRLVRSLR